METKYHNECLSDPKQADRLLNGLFQIADFMNAKHLSAAGRMDKVLTVVLEYLGVEQGSLMVVERKKLVVRAASRAELIGHKQDLSDDSVAGWVAIHAKPLFIADISQDSRFAKRDGAYKKNSLLSVPVVHKEKVIGVINASDKTGSTDFLKEDISCLLNFSSFLLWSFMQQDLHKKITQQSKTLKKRNRELRHQEEMREQLSRMLIHDLKAPLSEVVANLDILSYSIGDEQREFLEAAQMGCDRSVRMVSNLVTIDQISEGKLEPLHEETEVIDLLGEAVSAVKGLASIKGINLREEGCYDCPLLYLDRVLILRVLQNLLTNSLSYNGQGATITVGSKVLDEKQVEFFVQDQGPGIPLEQQQSIFDKYARISSKQDALVGTGLGLYFCKLAVELHKGTIGVESGKGKGSRFFFTLPIKKIDQFYQ